MSGKAVKPPPPQNSALLLPAGIPKQPSVGPPDVAISCTAASGESASTPVNSQPQDIMSMDIPPTALPEPV